MQKRGRGLYSILIKLNGTNKKQETIQVECWQHLRQLSELQYESDDRVTTKHAASDRRMYGDEVCFR